MSASAEVVAGLLALIRQAAREDRVLSYVDSPLQHVARNVLSKMKRGGDPASYRAMIERMRSIVPDITVRPYMMQDMGSGITIGGVTYAVDQFELTIDNHIEPTFMQGQSATDLEPADREVHLKIRTKYNTAEAVLQTLAITGPVLGTPVTGSLAFTNGANSVTFTFAALVAVPKSVTVNDKKKLRWDGEFRAYKVGTTLEVVTVFV